MIEETLEEAAERFLSMCDGNVVSRSSFITGAKWQAERMYEDMQEYAKFCIECDRKEMPLLLVKDWYEHYKK